jgi:lysyl-tRNA synthetase, class II
VVRRAGSVPVAVAAALAAYGWLYLARLSLPGPRLGDALPLDELSKHASVPLLEYLAVWGAAAVLIGLYARWAGLARLSAALLLAVTVGGLQYLGNGASVAIVRQISASGAFDASARVEVTYLPAALVAIACALLAEERARPRRAATLVVPTVVTIAGLLNLMHVLLPGDSAGLVRDFTPDAVGPLARSAGAPLSVALLIAARGLARRRRRAWQVAVAVAAISTFLHVLHGLNDGTLTSAVVLVLLLARRADYQGPGDITTRVLVLSRIVVSLSAIVGFGVVALWANRVDADQPFTARFAATEIAKSLVGLHVHGSPHLAGEFGEWFGLALPLLGASATLWILAAWLAPWRHRVREQERERETARALVRAWATDTLAPFVLRADKSYFFTPDESAFLAYRVVAGVAVVSGDPIGPPGEFAALVEAFLGYARDRGWRVAILGVSESCLPLYERHGLRALYHGDEAVVDTAAFSLDGRTIRKVRQSVHRLERQGYEARVLRPSEVDGVVRAQLEQVSAAWRGDAPERGFVMALDTLFSLGDEDAVFVVGFAPDGAVAGFLHFAVARGASALSLSSMPRLAETPNGFNEWLICEAVRWARENRFARVSLNFAPFAALLAPEAELSGLEKMQKRALLTLKGHFQLDNLLVFNRKFAPEWERRFVVFERRRDLPRVGVAALAAEAYLPFQGTRK